MAILKQYQRVRVIKLLRNSSDYDGWKINTRAPVVGDIGTIVDILSTPSNPSDFRYVVESTFPDGTSICLGEFKVEELIPLA